MSMCMQLCAHVCGKLVAYDHVILLKKIEVATLLRYGNAYYVTSICF